MKQHEKQGMPARKHEKVPAQPKSAMRTNSSAPGLMGVDFGHALDAATYLRHIITIGGGSAAALAFLHRCTKLVETVVMARSKRSVTVKADGVSVELKGSTDIQKAMHIFTEVLEKEGRHGAKTTADDEALTRKLDVVLRGAERFLHEDVKPDGKDEKHLVIDLNGREIEPEVTTQIVRPTQLSAKKSARKSTAKS